MPKAARRQSGPKAIRSEPYPPIRPGDKPPLTEKTTNEINKPTETSSTSDKVTKKTAKTTKATKAPKERPEGSYLDIKLDGEEKGRVPIHDTCSEIRRKITSLLLKDNQKPENGMPGEFKKDGTPKPWTKSAFCKQLGVSTTVLDTFMKAKMVMGGAESAIYTPAYIFFEKKRIFEGKKKTAGRLKVEENHPNGLELVDPNKVRVWCRFDEDPRQFLNEYGQ